MRFPPGQQNCMKTMKGHGPFQKVLSTKENVESRKKLESLEKKK
jgi:hypothetical protein